jgi:hypothetical protein
MPVIKIDLNARKKYLEAHPSLHKVEDIYDMLKDKAKEVFITGFKDYPDIDIDSIFAEFVEFALRA